MYWRVSEPERPVSQAAVMSFGDTFVVTAFFVVATMPLVLLLGRSKSKGFGGGGH